MSKPARRASFRKLHGILLLDKPQGVSSNQALQRVRHLFRAEKAGHTGALDPLATGLLPICFGEATKLAGRLLGESKAYLATAQLGQVTDTDDADGQLLRTLPVPVLQRAQIEQALQALTGTIAQVPPIYSALKRGGEALYHKARRGEMIELSPRPVQVDCFRLQAMQLQPPPVQLSLHVECGSGTYVRALVRDLGQALGCGAHVRYLRRLWVAPFYQPRMYTLAQLQQIVDSDGLAGLDACLLPIQSALQSWPQMVLDAEQARLIGQGRAIAMDFAADLAEGAEIALLDTSGQVLGLAQRAGSLLKPKRLFSWAVSGAGDAARKA